MIQTLAATLMWALVASLLVFRRKRADRSITYAAITIAIAMTLNVDAIYTAVDPLLGGTNIATLAARPMPSMRPKPSESQAEGSAVRAERWADIMPVWPSRAAPTDAQYS